MLALYYAKFSLGPTTKLLGPDWCEVLAPTKYETNNKRGPIWYVQMSIPVLARFLGFHLGPNSTGLHGPEPTLDPDSMGHEDSLWLFY
jgi:hypothetical protein